MYSGKLNVMVPVITSFLMLEELKRVNWEVSLWCLTIDIVQTA